MGLLSFLTGKPNPDKIAENLSTIIIQVAVYESEQIAQVWKVSPDDRTLVYLFIEYSTMLVSIADRLAHKKWGDPFRSQVMNLVIDHIKEAFCQQSHYGNNVQERGLFFERIFQDRFQYLAKCESIMGDGNQIVWTTACYLVDSFLELDSEALKANFALETAKAINKSVTAIIMTKPFKAIS